ncbi:hypothetical protein IFM89_005660 [Coptis chinensis]|uniref:Peptidase A1 domain-containing protein n=1 Tax=Coptis chinensis TaxID=261450 RepID=A0A835LB13_9MAGN|nr:hypothetical protein IFM89_005660 [Coptis chinensis]
MVKSKLSFMFLAIFIFLFSSVLSRTIEKIPKTSVLDVSASIQKTLEIISFNPNSVQPLESQQKITTSPSLALKLYSRETLYKSPFKNYRDLTLSRLQHDSARVNFLNQKVNLATKENEKSLGLMAMNIETPITSGLNQGSLQYFVRFGIGTPPKQFYTAIDTGSTITWIQCAPCRECYKQTDPLFDPATSSYKPLPCASQQCQELQISACSSSNNCLYGVEYGDNSTTVGDFITETLTLDNSVFNNIAMGCGRNNTGLFVGAAGILGLGLSSLAFPSQINNPSFSYCLVDIDSTTSSTLEFGLIATSNDAITTPLIRNSKRPTKYYVGLTGISVGGQMLPISPSVFAISPSGSGGVLVDSGTIVTRFTPEVYNILRDEFVNATQGLPTAGRFGLFDTCFNLTSRTPVRVPSVAFQFGNVSLDLPAKNYMVPVDNNVFCLGFAATPVLLGSISIIGTVQQHLYYESVLMSVGP